jgi:hypothetical protein
VIGETGFEIGVKQARKRGSERKKGGPCGAFVSVSTTFGEEI